MQNTPIRNKREPFFNNVPPGVLILGGVIGGIELFLQIFGLEWRSAAFLFLAFFPLDFGAPYKELFFAQNLVMFFSYSFLHGNFFHMIINVAIFFALGKQIEKQLGTINLMFIFLIFFGFIKGKELIYRIRHNLTILPFLNLIFGLIILHIILVLLYPTIIPFQIGWQGHLGGFVSGLILASLIRK